MNWDNVYKADTPSIGTNLICECLHKLGTLDYMSDRHPDTTWAMILVQPVTTKMGPPHSYAWRIFLDICTGVPTGTYTSLLTITQEEWRQFDREFNLAERMDLVRDRVKTAFAEEEKVEIGQCHADEGWETASGQGTVFRRAYWGKVKT